MKCLSCQLDNKDDANVCRKCGSNLKSEPLWQPSMKWHLRVLGIIYCVLIVAYFGISNFLSKAAEPYRMRERPAEITPWIKK